MIIPLGNTDMNKHQQAAIGLDLGSTTIKGVVLSEDGSISAAEKVPMKYLTPRRENPQLKEFSPLKVKTSICTLIHKLLLETKKKDISLSIKSCSINGATGNAVLLDDNKNPIGNAISWLDRRVEDKAEDILQGVKINNLHEIVGWPWRGSFTFPLLGWLKKYKSELYRQSVYPSMYIEYLVHVFTGEWEIDTSNATLSFLQDQKNLSWYSPYCYALDMEPSTRPAIRATGDIIGKGCSDFCKATGLSEETTIVHGSFDHPGAARAVDVVSENDILLSCGTSWVVFCPITKREDALSLGFLIDPFLSPFGGPWGGMFSLSRIGTVIDEYVRIITKASKKNRYVQFNELACHASPGAHGLFLHLLEKREQQVTKEEIAHHDPADVARALMEGPAFELYSNLKKLEKSGGEAKRIVLVGGPAESPVWPQIIADITGLTIEIQEGQFTGALGAAKVAGTALELFDSSTSTRFKVGKRVLLPDIKRHKTYQELYERYIDDDV